MDSYLLVIITRTYVQRGSRQDEFVHSWGLRADLNEKWVLDSDIARVLVVHGCSERSKEDILAFIGEALNDEKSQSARSFLLYHGGADWRVERDDIQRLSVHAAIAYGTESGGLLTTIQKELVDKNKLPADILKEIKKVYTDHQQDTFSLVKHRIINLLYPVAVALEGWQETGFDEAYARKMVNVYVPHTGEAALPARERLERVRRLIYGEEGQTESVSDVFVRVLPVIKARDPDKIKALYSAWDDLCQKVPNATNAPWEAYCALECLETLEGIESLLKASRDIQERVAKDFINWFRTIDTKLNEFQDALEASGRNEEDGTS